MEPEYSWETVRSSGAGYHREPVNRSYGWWVTLAVILAVLFHVGMFVVFGKIEVRQWGAMYEEVIQLSRDREKITLDDLTLSQLQEEETPAPSMKEMPKEVPVESLPMEIPEVMESIRLTPAVSEPQNLFAAAAPPAFTEAANLGVVEETMSFDLTELAAGEAVKGELLKASEKASTQQPKIYIQESELQMGLESDQLVKEMTDTLGGAEAAKIRGRFDSLDELLGSGKAMPDSAEILIPTDLLFEFGSAEVKEEAKLSLMKLGMLIMANPKSTYLFKGFTDSIPFRPRPDRVGPRDNLELSLARAAAVRDWLANALDLTGYDLQIVGFGSNEPLVEPTGNVQVDMMREALNRRVEVEIISKR